MIDIINRIILEEVDNFLKFEEFKRFIDDRLEMPDKLVATLVRFLRQVNNYNKTTGRKFAKNKKYKQ